ncbi:MipA/OmpV family protein [Acinetobacter rathckeae]|uniref:MipA/OmpV family protein n=1 Tax=Acinetobacter rathckeae TaxID=2605272 RepID=UPI0018A2C1C3|nr:MipA/OmpV family protein [Acinetobacter rathckeae]MBF7687864.1 MipA/OmpV family protein [Acinetobacter rathckeae]MBF7687913.1 MipA/OmpV family protein [Acinetobacter rathckeae]MBF7696034.1 MipA/OmpV family protein [Acinetobacter rathckeae]
MLDYVNRFKYTFATTAVMMVLTITSDAHADPSPTLQIGVAGAIDIQAYKNNNFPVTTFPSIFFDSKHFYIDGDEVGVYALHTEKHQLKLNLYYDSTEFKPSDTLSQLNKRRPALMAGGSYTYISPYGGFQILAEKDVQSRRHGSFATLAYLAEAHYKQWTFSPELGVQWNDQHYNNYYYGVSHAEAERSQIQEYRPKQSIQPYFSLDIGYQINPHWTLYTSHQVTRLSRQQQQSPMVDKVADVSNTLGILYRF